MTWPPGLQFLNLLIELVGLSRLFPGLRVCLLLRSASLAVFGGVKPDGFWLQQLRLEVFEQQGFDLPYVVMSHRRVLPNT